MDELKYRDKEFVIINMSENSKVCVSIVVPFYKGNIYLKRLLNSVKHVQNIYDRYAIFEVIIVNDSPDIDVVVPPSPISNIEVLKNSRNMGIHASRVEGLMHSKYEWVLFLDQDDEIIAKGFGEQLKLTRDADVVVGNGEYSLGEFSSSIYKSKKSMNYLIKKERFVKIRNLIPSPGACLIKKDIIPNVWTQNIMKNNGADDWFLWLALFSNEARFALNFHNVYRHNDSNGDNVSADLQKMRISSLEMTDILENNKVMENEDIIVLRDAIEFKFLQDTHNLSISKLIKMRRPLYSNIKYRVVTDLYNLL